MIVKKRVHRMKFIGSLLLTAVITTGCVVNPAKKDQDSSALLGDALRTSNFVVAQETITGAYDGDENQTLLLMESGLVNYLSKDYQQSINKLNKAELLTNELETKRASEYMKSVMTGPSSLSYAGTPFERAFIHYYKAMNFLMQANAVTGSEKEHALEGARIEARKVDLLLNSIQDQEGSYEDVEEGKESTFKKMMSLLRGLNGRTLNPDDLAYREDAYMRYMEGIIYESNGEFDAARVAYQAAAELYEKGYAKQYGLGQDIIDMAWFDVVRIMNKAGGYEDEAAHLTENKLPEKMKLRLNEFGQNTAQLVIINHVGFSPKRKEMDLRLQLDTIAQELVLTPAILNPHLFSKKEEVDPIKRDEQLTWFNEMYSDRGLLSVIGNFKQRGALGVINGLTEKRTSIGPLWSLAEEIGLVSGLDLGGTYVQVPYFGSIAAGFSNTSITLNGEAKGAMVTAESLASIALQQQLLSAGDDLQGALARELTKVAFCSKAAAQIGGGILGKAAEKACIIGFGLVSGADTRSWSTLPHAIMVQRYPLKAGQHTVKIVTEKAEGNGIFHQAAYEIELKKGELKVLNNRAISTPEVIRAELIAAKSE